MMRLVVGLVMMALLAACGGVSDLKDPPVPLGDFRLEHNVVVASKVQTLPISRAASEEELVAAVQGAIAERFGRYQGSSDYHFGVSIEAYILAAPGVPVLLAPKSTLILNLTVYDDAAGKKLNDEPEQITVLETFGSESIIGTGYTMTAEEQLTELSRNAAKAIERYLVRQQELEGWFTPEPLVDVADAAPAVSN